VPEWSIGAAC